MPQFIVNLCFQDPKYATSGSDVESEISDVYLCKYSRGPVIPNDSFIPLMLLTVNC